MAKKSNKTEQVLKLITKDGEEQPAVEQPVVEQPDVGQPDVEIAVKPQKEEQHKIETKLKIEIEPEIEIKKQPEPQKELSIAVQAPAQEPVNNVEDDRERLINLTEHLVKDRAKEIMERLNVCSCHTCTQDVLALTLNSLDNRFITTKAGKLHVQLEFYKKQYETDIIAALTKACVRVKVSPRHEK